MKTDAIGPMKGPYRGAAELVCHRSRSCLPVHRIEASVDLPRKGILQLRFVLEGELAALSLPPPAPVRWTRGLWEHTCFEAFLKPDDGAQYLEFNFSPSGEWAAFVFSGYRVGKAFGEKLQPALARRQTENRLELDATLGPELLAGIGVYTGLRIALCTVVEDAGGNLSYWALRHPAEAPDFHHPDGFALTLAHHPVTTQPRKNQDIA
ncbi:MULTISPECIES: DOMON-like domain-containing protein [Methylococcus]|uniref:DOMON-like domain-containing protein n=1 Tax=Methylococcus capsulatus TaxID=414 RepID=A0ABZ2F686_METCP|nr:DOMON-like domain-containing protein [Methylococcus capsulatus]